MTMISNEQINSIRNSVDIVDVISQYLPLTNRGKNYFGVCPFHNDNNPSMSVSKELQIYTCFSCGATGNVLNFIMDYENMSFMEALKKIADMGGINIDIAVSNKNNKKSNLYDIYDIANKFYQNNIHSEDGQKAKKYLHNRNIKEDIIKEFGIGLSLHDRDMLVKLLINKKCTNEDLEKSGLVVKNDYGYNDIYYNRIMFPLHDLLGKIVGFSGRIYDSDDSSKYINTKETEIFKKGEILYNFHRAKDECRKLDTVIIMEGFMDVIRAYSVGIKNVIAVMGTAVTRNQIASIKKMAHNVILCFDGDDAGIRATISCADDLLKNNVVPKIIKLEDGSDPDDYIQTFGKDKFQLKIDNPMNIMDFKMEYLKFGKNLSNTEEQAHYLNEIIIEIRKINDDILKELTLQKISQESNIDIELLKKKLNDFEDKKVEDKKIIKHEYVDKYQKAQVYLLYYMLRSNDVIKIYNKKVTYMSISKYRFLAREISYYYKTYPEFNLADFYSFLNDKPDLLETLKEIQSIELKENYNNEEINDYTNVIDEENVRMESNRLLEQIKKELDPKIRTELVQKICDLKVRGKENV